MAEEHVAGILQLKRSGPCNTSSTVDGACVAISWASSGSSGSAAVASRRSAEESVLSQNPWTMVPCTGCKRCCDGDQASDAAWHAHSETLCRSSQLDQVMASAAAG